MRRRARAPDSDINDFDRATSDICFRIPRAKAIIHNFRYYEEQYFTYLDDMTSEAYRRMAEFPIVPNGDDRMLSDENRELTGSPAAPKIFVDATGLLPMAGQPMSGIPRVEEFLLRHAIADPDPAVVIVGFDSTSRKFCVLSDVQKSLLVSSWEGARRRNENPERPVCLGIIFERVRENSHLARNFDRDMATQITGGVARGPRYVFFKHLIRGYRLYQKLRRRLLSSQQPTEPIDPGVGTVLLSSVSIFSSAYFPYTLAASTWRAFISHDVIPISNPELAISERHANRFKKNLTVLLRSGAHPLVASKASMATLNRFTSERKLASTPAEKFPMPSLLWEKAKELKRTSRFEAVEPFVIYCSTAESRKNHILLARVWARTLREGIRLPQLICAGKWGWGVEHLSKFMSLHPDLPKHVKFVGMINDSELIDLYRSALFGVFPSRIEGWGFGAAECLAFGTPVIISTAPSLNEATFNLMPSIDPDNEDGWYDHIRLLSENISAREALRAKIARHYRTVSSKESWHAIKAIISQAN